ncbi:hypothetical protein BLOT_000377, partial [Blomia tropicalis]
ALYFKEQDIDEYRDCFYLKTQPNSGHITSVDELKTIMRSLGTSPTQSELEQYFKEKNCKISFADLLDIMHTHSVKEKIPKEILDAFVSSDWSKSGQMLTKDLKHILCDWGEKLDPKQFDRLMREANIGGSYFKYEDFVKIISAPIPDY